MHSIQVLHFRFKTLKYTQAAQSVTFTFSSVSLGLKLESHVISRKVNCNCTGPVSSDETGDEDNDNDDNDDNEDNDEDPHNIHISINIISTTMSLAWKTVLMTMSRHSILIGDFKLDSNFWLDRNL